MKYSEDILGSRSDLGTNLKKVVSDLLAGRLVVEGQTVEIPADVDPDMKVKYAVDEASGAVTLKITWDTGVETETEEETF